MKNIFKLLLVCAVILSCVPVVSGTDIAEQDIVNLYSADSWEVYNEIIFNSADSTKYSLSAPESSFSTAEENGALKITKKDDSENIATLELNFEKAISSGEYYIEFEYLLNTKNRQIWASFSDSGQEAITFTIDHNAKMGLALRTDATATGSGSWLSGTLPPHTNNADEKLGFLINADTQAVKDAYVNRTAVGLGTHYFRSSNAKQINKFKLEMQKTMKTSDSLTLKNIKIWQKQAVNPEKQGFDADVAALTYESITNEDKNAVTANLNLKTELANGSAVTWKSSNIDVIDNTGKVTPSDTGDTTVTLTAAITSENGNFSTEKTFTFTVLQSQNQMTAEERVAADLLLLTYDKITNENINAITKNLVLPKVMPNKSSVLWSSDNAAIASDGTVTAGDTDEKVILTATVAYGNIQKTKDFTFYVARKGSWSKHSETLFREQAGEGYNFSGSDDSFNKEFLSDGVKITKIADSSDIAGLTQTFASPLTGGKYYIEFEYFTNINNGQIWATIQSGGSEAITFTLSKGSAVSLALRTDASSDKQGTWISGTLPPHTNNANEKLGFVVTPSQGAINEIYVNRVKVNRGELYFRNAGLENLTGMRLEMQSGMKTGDTATFKNITVWKEKDAKLDIEEAAESLDYSDITDENPALITKNLTLPQTLVNGARVNWSASDESVISSDGTINRASADKTVTLFAEIWLGTERREKEFTFTVLSEGAENSMIFFSADSFENTASGWSINAAGGTAISQNGKMVLTRNNELLVLNITKNLVKEEGGYRITGDKIIAEYDISASGGITEVIASIFSANGDLVGELKIVKNGSEYFVNTADFSKEYSIGSTLHVKYEINTETKTANVYLDNVKALSYTIEKAENVSSLLFEVKGGAGAEIAVDNVKTASEISDKYQARALLDLENLSFEDISDDSPAELFRDLHFVNKGLMESDILWQSSDVSLISNDGTVTRSNENKNAVITATIKNGEYSYNKQFNVTVLGKTENNLAFGKTVITGSRNNEGFEKENAVDAAPSSAWITSDKSTAPYLTVDLGEAKEKVSRVILSEAAENGIYLVKGFEIAVSDDNSTWTTVYKGTSVGKDMPVNFAPRLTRYIRYKVTSKDNGNTGLYEIELYYEPIPKIVVEGDIALIDTGSYEINGDRELPKEGVYGSVIEWVSSQPEYFSNDGKLVKRPGKNTAFTLTATVSYGDYSEKIIKNHYIVGKGGSTPAGGGSGGGTGGSLANSGSVNIVTGSSGTSPQPTPDITETYSDVPKTSWSYEYIEELSENGIVNGGGDGKFYPERAVSREEFIKMLLGTLKINIAETENIFEDVEKDSWYAPYVNTAASLGIVKGITETSFGTGSDITRQDMAVLVIRALEAAGKEITPQNDGIAYLDAETIDDYAKEAVEIMTKAGIINGEGGSFLPKEKLTREQAAKIICLIGR